MAMHGTNIASIVLYGFVIDYDSFDRYMKGKGPFKPSIYAQSEEELKISTRNFKAMHYFSQYRNELRGLSIVPHENLFNDVLSKQFVAVNSSIQRRYVSGFIAPLSFQIPKNLAENIELLAKEHEKYGATSIDWYVATRVD